jgi:hypothetical protein
VFSLFIFLSYIFLSDSSRSPNEVIDSTGGIYLHCL